MTIDYLWKSLRSADYRKASSAKARVWRGASGVGWLVGWMAGGFRLGDFYEVGSQLGTVSVGRRRGLQTLDERTEPSQVHLNFWWT